METVRPIRSRQAIKRIKQKLEDEERYRDLLLFTLGINTALRISDILRLKLGDVLMETGDIKDIVELRERKTGKARVIPISESVKTALRKYRKDLARKKRLSLSQPLFTTRWGRTYKVMSRQMAWYMIKKVCRQNGVRERVGTHTLRKTFGYHAYKSGVDLALLSELFNHSSSAVTRRYIGITQEDCDGVVLKLNL